MLSLIVLFGLSCFAIRSNLPRKRVTPSTASRVSRRNRIPIVQAEQHVTDVPVDFQMVEMLQSGYVPPEIVHPDLIMSAALQKRTKDDPVLAENHIVEIFKVRHLCHIHTLSCIVDRSLGLSDHGQLSPNCGIRCDHQCRLEHVDAFVALGSR